MPVDNCSLTSADEKATSKVTMPPEAFQLRLHSRSEKVVEIIPHSPSIAPSPKPPNVDLSQQCDRGKIGQSQDSRATCEKGVPDDAVVANEPAPAGAAVQETREDPVPVFRMAKQQASDPAETGPTRLGSGDPSPKKVEMSTSANSRDAHQPERDHHSATHPVSKAGESKNNETRVQQPALPQTQQNVAPLPTLFAGHASTDSLGKVEAEPPVSEPPQLAPELAHMQTPRQDLKEIRLVLPDSGIPGLEVRLAERAGTVQVSVHSSDAEARTTLRANLQELVHSMDNHGFSTDIREHTTPEETQPAASSGGMSQNLDDGREQERKQRNIWLPSEEAQSNPRAQQQWRTTWEEISWQTRSPQR
ncbi:MAG: flagellar hook-length control protein FliK [Acidobacteria bacterium]|nr:flagellar hook-length control protein FliK [Acidobacteriota bacterium]